METLLIIWEYLTLNIDNPVFATIVGVFFSYLGGTVITKGIRVFLMLVLYVVKALKDKIIDDTEAVVLFWHLVGVVYGFWPNDSRAKILKYAPPHWHVLIQTGKSPDFELTPIVKPKGD